MIESTLGLQQTKGRLCLITCLSFTFNKSSLVRASFLNLGWRWTHQRFLAFSVDLCTVLKSIKVVSCALQATTEGSFKKEAGGQIYMAQFCTEGFWRTQNCNNHFSHVGNSRFFAFVHRWMWCIRDRDWAMLLQGQRPIPCFSRGPSGQTLAKSTYEKELMDLGISS